MKRQVRSLGSLIPWTVSLVTVKRKAAGTVSGRDSLEKKDEEENRHGTGPERVTNSLLMTIYRQFPCTA